MRKFIASLLLATLCVGLCACSQMSDVESKLHDNYKLETLTTYDLESLAEPLEMDIDDYRIFKAVQATHRDHGYSVVILECDSTETAMHLEDDLFHSVIVDVLESLYSSSYSFLVNRYETFVMVGERRAVVDVFSACKAIEGPGFLFWLIIIVGIACGCGYISQRITSNKGYYGGFAWGFFLGPIGILIANNQPAAPTTTKTSEAVMEHPQPNPKATTTQASQWKCTCGRSNAQYIRTCICGLSKIQVLHPTIANNPQPETVKSEEVSTPAANDTEPENTKLDTEKNNAVNDELGKISAIKEYKVLLDSGVITEEEFNEKKHQLLGM